MNEASKLPKVTQRGKKRLGRGYGSGKGGHTSSRGQKGQKARRSIGVLFEGIKVRKSLLKRLPQLRGKEKNKSRKSLVVLKVSDLEPLRSGALVDIKTLIEAGLVDARSSKKYGVKILGGGKLTKKLNVELPTSLSAKKQIEKAGGKVKGDA